MRIPIGLLIATITALGSSYSNDAVNTTSYHRDDIKTSYNQSSVRETETITLLNGNIPTLSNFPNSSDPHGNLTRARRNADPLSEYSHKLSTVARISNGISLLAGLINGNIPVDSVIQELLNFGDVKVQEVLALDKNKVDAAMDKLDAATTDFVFGPTSKLPRLEKQTLAVNEMREAYKNVGDFSSYKAPTEYFNKVKDFKDDTTDLGVFVSLNTTIIAALANFEAIKNAPVLTSTNYDRTSADIKELRDHLQAVVDSTAKFQLIVGVVDNFEDLSKPEETFKTLIQMLEVLAVRQKFKYTGTTGSNELADNMAKIKTLSEALDPSQTDLTNIRSLLSSLTSPSITRRQFTPGFVKGASDLKLLTSDIRDPSVEQTIGTGKNFARLSGGLKPLETLSNKLDPVENKLRPAAEDTITKSTSSGIHLLSLIANLEVDSSVITGTLKDVSDNEVPEVATDLTDPINTVIANAKLLASQLQSMKDLVNRLPENPTDLTAVYDILNQLDPRPAHTDVQTVRDNLNAASEKVEKVKEHLTDLQSKLLNAPKAQTVKTLADTVLTGQAEIDTFLGEQKVIDATGKLNIVKDFTGPVEKIAQAVQASQIIRDFKKDDITNIKTAVDTISQVFGLISEVQAVPDSMKTDQTEDVKELVKMESSAETATTLGFVAGSIRKMDGLRGLEASVETLKNDQLFDAEVEKLTDPEKSEIKQKYIAHKTFVNALDTSLQQINMFKSALITDADLRNLGTPLTAATSIADVPSIQDASEALEMLILEVTDPQTYTNLQALKDHMDQLKALDLQFASGSSVFSQVPAALQGLFTFLTNFLTPPPPPTVVVPRGGPPATSQPQQLNNNNANGVTPTESAGFNMLILVYIGAGLLVFGVGGVIGYFVYVHHRDKKKPWDVINKLWIEPIFGKDVENFGFATGGWDLIRNTKAPARMCGDVVDSKMRRSDKFIKSTAVRISNGFIYANWIKTMGPATFIATQGPLDGKEAQVEMVEKDGKMVKESKSRGKVDTREDFIQMCVENQAEFIVQLCDVFEPDMENPGFEVQKSAPYFPEFTKTETYGRYEVTTDAEETILDLEGVKRTLRVLDTKTNKTHTLTQLHWLEWPDHGHPGSIEKGHELMEMVNKSKKPIVVHCSMGMGRTCSFIAIEYLAREAERHPAKRAAVVASSLRYKRHNAIQSSAQFYYSVMGAIRMLAKEYGADFNNPDDLKTIVYETHKAQYNDFISKLNVIYDEGTTNFRVEYKKKKEAHEAAAAKIKAQQAAEKEKPKKEEEVKKSGEQVTPEGSKSTEKSREPAGKDCTTLDLGF